MKKTSTILLALAISCGTFAQSFDDGANIISVGFGIPPSQRIENDFHSKYSSFIDYKLNNYGTAVLKYEHGLHQNFGLGLNTEYSGASVSYKYDDSNAYRYERKVKANVFGFYARFNGHLPVNDKFDIYGGMGLGYSYTINKKSDSNPNPDTNTSSTEKILDFDYQGTIGLRFMVKDKIGLFAEVGWATTIAQVGFAFKL